ncbi:HD domain-containing protein [Mycoplasma parvum]|uniref:HD/PDEase domain-containing protein n=1 Tax=Mycoplasma parvum str. Indiana TaxID=1403316 RepID=U5ND23_9MOLU|nr:HD domain-containing protein [Mycoplasma parvum]AGX89322.1 hypothetical protein PRV_02985 [Mycoplasma parvum str. Indiana]
MISNFSISQILLLSKEEKNKDLELNLCELNLFLENLNVVVNKKVLSPLGDILKNSFYLEKKIWNQFNELTKNLNKFFLLLEINKLKEIKNLLEQNELDFPKEKLLGLFCFNKKTKKMKLYDISSNKWINNNLEEKNINNLAEINKALRKTFKEQTLKRFEHTIRVLETAHLISSKVQLNEKEKNKLLLACAYHDFCKNWTLRRLLFYSKKIFINRNKEELLKEAWGLHGPVASFILKRNKLLKDEEVLLAITNHTYPDRESSIIGKILIIADKIEPNKISNFNENIYKELWNYLRFGDIESTFKFLLENHKPKTEWRKE